MCMLTIYAYHTGVNDVHGSIVPVLLELIMWYIGKKHLYKKKKLNVETGTKCENEGIA